jgi:hypothetical protein
MKKERIGAVRDRPSRPDEPANASYAVAGAFLRLGLLTTN